MSVTSNPIPIFGWATAAPTDTNTYHQVGSLYLNSAPTAGGAFGWVCETAGRPGTFRTVGVVAEKRAVTLTAAAALTNGAGLQLITLAAGSTMTLAQAASHAAGFTQVIKNLANNSVTIATAAGATYHDAAAITLAQNASVTIVGDGSQWYLAA